MMVRQPLGLDACCLQRADPRRKLKMYASKCLIPLLLLSANNTLNSGRERIGFCCLLSRYYSALVPLFER